MLNLITIENTNAVVELSTIIKFSGLKEKQVQDLIRTKFETLSRNGMKYPFKFDLSSHELKDRTLNYSEMKFDEKSCTLLLTLLPNNEITEKFKEELVNQFFSMRDSIQQIREQTLLDTFKEEKRLAIEESNKLNDYNGFISVQKFVTEIDTSVSKDDVWDALEFMNYSKHIIRSTKYRRLADDCSELVGSTIKGTTGTPIFTEVAIKQAIRKHREYKDAVEGE